MLNKWNVIVKELNGEKGTFEFTSKNEAKSFKDEAESRGIESARLVMIHNKFVVTDSDTWTEGCDCGDCCVPCGAEYICSYEIGYDIAPTPVKGVELRNGLLFIGNYEVSDYEQKCISVAELAGHIPQLFLIRSFDYYHETESGRSYPSLVGGLDLLADGRIWVIGISKRHSVDGKDYPEQFFDNGQDAIDYLNATLREGWIIHLEEPTQK